MKIIYLLILFIPSLYANENTIYTADMEYIITQVKDYKQINDELTEFKNKLDQPLIALRQKILNKKNNNISLSLFNSEGRENWTTSINQLELELNSKENENKYLLLEKERSLKFPLIKKVLEFIQKHYDRTEISFIVDPESIFFYKKPSTQVHDLTLEIINTYNRSR